MKEIKRRLVLDDFEYRLLVGCVKKARTMFIDKDKPAEESISVMHRKNLFLSKQCRNIDPDRHILKLI